MTTIPLLNGFRVPGIPEEQLFWLLHASMFRQYCKKVEHLQAGFCSLCQLDTDINRVVCKNDSWIAWPNPWPQPNQEHHLVIAHREHFKHVAELDPDSDWKDLGKLVRELTRMHYQIEGGVFAMRFGEPKLSLASEEHLHANIRVPDGSGPVAVTVAWNENQARDKVRIACIFEEIRAGRTSFEQLLPDERRLVEKFMD